MTENEYNNVFLFLFLKYICRKRFAQILIRTISPHDICTSVISELCILPVSNCLQREPKLSNSSKSQSGLGRPSMDISSYFLAHICLKCKLRDGTNSCFMVEKMHSSISAVSNHFVTKILQFKYICSSGPSIVEMVSTATQFML